MTTESGLITIQPTWWDEARALTRLPRYAAVRNKERLLRGFLAERAVIDALTGLVGGDGESYAVTWLSGGQPTGGQRSVPWQTRQRSGDLRWRGREIDVKLVANRHEYLLIKVGVQHLAHVFIEWAVPGVSFRMLGALSAHAAETFGPSAPLIDRGSGRPFEHLMQPGAQVNGWAIPRSRLHPLEDLLRDD